MRRRVFVRFGALMVTVLLVASADMAGQAPRKGAATVKSSASSTALPRTSWGAPDLQGVWANNSATPLERPAALAGKDRLNDAELAALKETAAQIFNGDGDAGFGDSVYEAALARAKNFKSTDARTGNYNHFWLVERDFDNRTSLIVDPADGKIPPLTADAQRRNGASRRAAASTAVRSEGGGRGYDSWEDRSLSERCITFGAPRLGAGYNSYYQIFQTADYVAIGMETIHDARIIPLDGRSHLASNVRQWLGDSRGHWEGDTLVVETSNYSPKSNLLGATESLQTVERFTRVSPTTIKYEVTLTDPTTWTRPWTVMIPLRQSSEEVYEFACHEGNHAMYGILSGARAKEKEAEQAAKTKSK